MTRMMACECGPFNDSKIRFFLLIGAVVVLCSATFVIAGSWNRAEGSPPSLSSVYGVRHWSTSDYTRVIIDLDNDARYEKTRLSDPDRVYFDIYSSKLTPGLLNKTFAVGDQFLKQVRLGQNKLEVVRVVLDFAGSPDF